MADDPATSYARHVVDGRILAGRFVRLACQRHLDDLQHGHERGLTFNATAAQIALDFFPTVLCLAGGEHEGRPFVLQPWQRFIVGNLFGWFSADGLRRFRTAWVELAKGNGKSPIAAGIGLYMLLADSEPRAEVYAAATKKDQAMILFRDAIAMVDQSPALTGQLVKTGAPGREWNLAHTPSASFFRPIASDDGQSGPRVHCGLIDEIHEHRDDTVVQMMRAGTKGRRQALLIEITNSGHDRNTIAWEHHEYSRKVLEGVLPNDSWFAYVAQLDLCDACLAKGKTSPSEECEACDTWTDEQVWIKSNPNLDVSITRKYLREQVNEALGVPSKVNYVKRLNMCIWTEGVERWFGADAWARGSARIDPRSLEGRSCIAGIDLSTTTDLSALVLVFPDANFYASLPMLPDTDDAGVDPDVVPDVAVKGGIDVLAWFWCPEENIRARSTKDRVPYDVWRRDGFLEATPGEAIDYRFIRRRLRELRDVSGYNIAEVAYDPAFAEQFRQGLEADGFTTLRITQGFNVLTPACLVLESLVASGSIRHGGHPVLGWCASNVVLDRDGGGRLRPSKGRSTERIDGITALVTALTRVITQSDFTSVYTTRGLEFV